MTHVYHHPMLVTNSTKNSTKPEWYKKLKDSLGEAHLHVAEALTPLLNGYHPIEEIYGKLLQQNLDPRVIFSLFEWLDEQKLIVEGYHLSLLSDSELKFYKSQIDMFAYLVQPNNNGISQWRTGFETQVALKRSSVAVVGLGRIGYALLTSLTLAGVGHLIAVKNEEEIMYENATKYDAAQFQKDLKSINPYVGLDIIDKLDDMPESPGEMFPKILIYCSDLFSEKSCERLNKICLDNLIPLLVYRQMLLEILVGPLIIPKETACYVCYNLRRKAALFEMENHNNNTMNPDIPRLNFPIGTDLLALDTIKFLTGIMEPISRNRIIRINIGSGHMEVHSILKLPRCTACGVHKTRPMRKLWEE